jgi:hypothetical protein
MTEHDIQDQLIFPILQEVGVPPSHILLPAEGNSSIYIQAWAEALHIPTRVFQPNWVRNGRIAQILRDEQIQKDCTHAIVFLAPRSNRLERMAEKMAKKGKVVFTSSTDLSLTQLVSPPETYAPSSTNARKSGKGTMQPLLKFQS